MQVRINTPARAKFFVVPETKAKQVLGYGVYDEVNGLRSQHAVYVAPGDGTIEVCKYLADEHCRDLNKGIK